VEIWQIGLLLGTYAVTAAIFELPLDAIADLYGRIKIYRLSRVVYISGVALALLSDEFYGLIGAMVVMGISQAINTGTVDAWQVEQINKKGYQESLQSYLSLFEMAMAAFIALGALVGGYLPERIDHSLTIRDSEQRIMATANLFLNISRNPLKKFLGFFMAIYLI